MEDYKKKAVMWDSAINRIKRSTFLHLCFGITFFSSGIIVNAVQCVLFLTLYRFNKELYRKINYYLCYTLYSQFVFLGEWWGNVNVIVHMNKDEYAQYLGREHAYLIMNHSWDIDWFVGWILCERVGALGNAKAYCKKAIKYIPVIGWAWLFAEFVFLERSYDKDKDMIGNQIKKLADHPDPIWLLMFAEGTRFTEEKHEISLKFAKEKGLTELKYHLLPRSKGLLASLPEMRGKVPCVMDFVVEFNLDNGRTPPTVMDVMNGKYIEAHMYGRRIPLEQVPEDAEGVSKFLKDLYIRKDKLRDNFKKTGNFCSSDDIANVDTFVPRRRWFTLINFVSWCAVVLIPICSYLFKLLFSGEILYFFIGVTILGSFYALCKVTVGMSEIKKGSSYGKEK